MAAPSDSSPNAWPDPSVIAQLANALFQAPPNQPVAVPASPGIPLAPPSPAFAPAPSVVTSVAPYAPAQAPYGVPDVPPTTIPSVVPTPNVSAPPAPTQRDFALLPPGMTDVPQPGASPGAFSGVPDLGDYTALVPPHHALDGAPKGEEGYYFLREAPLLSAPQATAPASPSIAQHGGLDYARLPDGASLGTVDGLYFLDQTPPVSYDAATASDAPRTIAPAPIARTPDLRFLPLDLRPEVVSQSGSGLNAPRPFDPHIVKRDFPILNETVNGRPLVWLDNAATTQKPQAVIDRLAYFYEHENSNIHRAAHELAARATDAYEAAREKVRRFLNAGSTQEIVFARGTTEAINLVAQAWGRRNVKKDDEIVVTWLEHHANIVPWQQLCAETGARLRVAPVDDHGQVILEEYEKLLGPRTRIVSITQVSNALGTIVPVREMTAMAHRHGACVLVDGAQAVSHLPIDVQAIDCDFYVFSGHKVFGPTGIGALYGKLPVLEAMPPWQGGGNMIADVTFEKTVYQGPPSRFEAGTGNIADAVGLGAALDYVSAIGMTVIDRYEHELLVYATERMLTVPGLKLIGTAKEKASVLSFVLDECRSEDVGKALNAEGIAVRAGHHCAQPILRRYGLESTVRPSLAFYNTTEDVDALVATLLRIQSGRGYRG